MVVEAVESAIASLGSPRNVVVVDDGSTERSTLLGLQRVRELGVSVLRPRNQGVSKARNVGLAQIDTPYAFVLDADDRIERAAPRIAAEVLSSDSRVAIVAGSGIEVDDDGSESMPIAPGKPSRDSMRHGTLIATASAFRILDWRRVGGFPTGLKLGEDWVFWMRLLRDGGVVRVVDDVIVRRRMHDGQVTRRYIDPRQSAAAANIVMRENPDLVVKHIDEFIEELSRTRALLSEYRHAYRRIDSMKVAVRTIRERTARRLHDSGREDAGQ